MMPARTAEGEKPVSAMYPQTGSSEISSTVRRQMPTFSKPFRQKAAAMPMCSPDTARIWTNPASCIIR